MKQKELYTAKLYDHSNTDLILWKKFLQGDDESFEMIYEKYIHSLFRYGIQFTHDKVVVEDAIHDVFVKLYHTRTRLKEEVNLKFYLFTALKNCLYNSFKRELIFEKLDEKELKEIVENSFDPSPLLPLEKDEMEENVLHLMSHLTERQREVIYYRFIEEMNMDEICALMHMNYQSVQNLIQRSLKKLRESDIPGVIVVFLVYRVI